MSASTSATKQQRALAISQQRARNVGEMVKEATLEIVAEYRSGLTVDRTMPIGSCVRVKQNCNTNGVRERWLPPMDRCRGMFGLVTGGLATYPSIAVVLVDSEGMPAHWTFAPEWLEPVPGEMPQDLRRAVELADMHSYANLVDQLFDNVDVVRPRSDLQIGALARSSGSDSLYVVGFDALDGNVYAFGFGSAYTIRKMPRAELSICRSDLSREKQQRYSFVYWTVVRRYIKNAVATSRGLNRNDVAPFYSNGGTHKRESDEAERSKRAKKQ